DLSDPVNMVRWRKIEAAKRYLFYALLRLHVPVRDRTQDPEHGLAFDFLADPPTPTPEEIPDGTPGASNEAPDGVPKVMTGHDNGLITIALIEADDAERERRRTELHEPYRSLLGHFRHEVGHYAWDLLIRDGGRLDACRTVFGDDSQDYGEALQRHYRNGAQPDWQDHFVSAYASSHPWEDWAETWAHYLHIVDTLEMAYAFGLRVRPRGVRDDSLKAAVDFDPYANVPMETIIDAWLPLTFAMNSLNRSMGQSDLYPFVLSPEVITKLAFVHRTVHEAAPATSVPSQPPVSASRPRARR
ncbi:MAG TPA: putative zinc-binding metallopeptidase, partial [Rhodopila sp.]|uniref:zinc-binding metallopeptidase family protein n=1 Tax=Rhodopila sp. TaxID=2480087 RepID=UPI002B9D10BB